MNTQTLNSGYIVPETNRLDFFSTPSVVYAYLLGEKNYEKEGENSYRIRVSSASEYHRLMWDEEGTGPNYPMAVECEFDSSSRKSLWVSSNFNTSRIFLRFKFIRLLVRLYAEIRQFFVYPDY